jgi:hypothetical protein
VFWDARATLPKVDDGLEKAEKATAEDATQPNQREKDASFIIGYLDFIWWNRGIGWTSLFYKSKSKPSFDV